MLRWLVVLLLLLSGRSVMADVHGAPLPKRARALDDGRYASPMGFRDTVDWYRKELKRRGINVEFGAVMKVRDVVFVRVLAKDDGLGWSALHIVLADGKTTVYVVAAFGGQGAGSTWKFTEVRQYSGIV
jgi:hypothetical protein